jgi:hypothetical protein
MDLDDNYDPIIDGLMAFGICENATHTIIDTHKNFFFPSVIPFFKKLLPTTQVAFATIMKFMDIPSDPGFNYLSRLKKILIEKPSLGIMLKTYPPKDINFPALLEVLDTLKAPGVAEVDIKNYLKAPATQWKEGIYRNQSSNVDPTVAAYRASHDDLKKLYMKMTK